MDHTKGPWGASATPSSSLSSIRRITGPDGEDIATIHCMAGEMDQEEALANARLIKTAPETAAERGQLKDAAKALKEDGSLL